MPFFNSVGAMVWPTAVFLLVVALGGSAVLLRRSGHKWLVRLSILACVVALVFAPMLRALPEEIGLPFFLVGLWPTLAIIAIAVVTSVVRFIQRRDKESLPSLILSLSAVGLFFYVSTTPSLVWPFRPYESNQAQAPTSSPVATIELLPVKPTPVSAISPQTPTLSPTPGIAKRVTFKAGQVVDVQPGIFFADIATGAIEGWQLSLDAAGGWANQVAMTSISPDGRFILYPAARYLDHWSDWSLLDTRTGKTCVLPEVRGWVGAFSPDGQTFVATTALGIARLGSDCAAGPQPLNLPADEQVDYAVWSPDGKALLVVTHRNLPESKTELLVTYYLINQALKEPVVVDQGQGRPIPPIWSPDGAHAVVVSPSWGKVQALDQAGEVVWATSLAASSVWNRGWSPDGRSIVLPVDVFTGDRSGRSYVYILDAATGKTRFRVLGAFAACGQIWTLDSQWFLVWSYGLMERPGRAPYYLVAADGSAVRHLDDDPTGYAAYLNNLSPKDASRAVVHTWNAAPGLDSLQVVDLKTGLKTPLVSTTVWSLGWGWNFPPRRWLSDGRLVFTTPGGYSGFCIPDSGTPEFRIEFPPFAEVQPVSPPRGK